MHDTFKNKQTVSGDVLKDLIDDYLNKFTQTEKIVLDPKKSYIQKVKVLSGSKIYIIGDIHGSIHSFLRILLDLQKDDVIDENFKIIQKNSYFLFTADYEDRGMYGAEVWYALLRLKLSNWDKVFISRGNHENKDQNEPSGFKELIAFKKELEDKYGNKAGRTLLSKFYELYRKLSLAFFVGSGKDSAFFWVQFCHGGLDIVNNPKDFLDSKEHLQKIDFDEDNDSHNLTWADFLLKNGNIVVKNRKDDFLLVKNAIELLNSYNLKAIFRGHQHSGCVLKLFGKKDGPYSGNKGGDPVCWKEVVTDEEKIAKKIKINDYFPVFTFTTATEFGLADSAGYGILTTADDYKDWTLTIREIELPGKDKKARDQDGKLIDYKNADDFLQEENKKLARRLFKKHYNWVNGDFVYKQNAEMSIRWRKDNWNSIKNKYKEEWENLKKGLNKFPGKDKNYIKTIIFVKPINEGTMLSPAKLGRIYLLGAIEGIDEWLVDDPKGFMCASINDPEVGFKVTSETTPDEIKQIINRIVEFSGLLAFSDDDPDPSHFILNVPGKWRWKNWFWKNWKVRNDFLDRLDDLHKHPNFAKLPPFYIRQYVKEFLPLLSKVKGIGDDEKSRKRIEAVIAKIKD